MEEELKNQDAQNEGMKEPDTQKKEAQKTLKKEPKKMKKRTLLVLAVLAIFVICELIVFRADYISTMEIGEQYVATLMQNLKYKINIGLVNFILVFLIVYINNGLIKKGLKKFFDEDKIEMPKLPNKSLALIISLVTSIVVSNLFLEKTILFMNSAWFGIPDPIYGLDIGFYVFKAPLIGALLYYLLTLVILLTVYTVIYYIVTFNIFFEGINGQTLKKNIFIKQILFSVMMIAIIVAGIILFNVQNIGTESFLTLNNELETSLVGAGSADGIKLWGYRILAIVIILSVYMAIKAFKKEKTKKVIKSLAIVPIYLVSLFIVMVGYDFLFIRGSELDKQKAYISTNINYTKTAYDINIEENSIENTGTITQKEADENRKIMDNIPIVTENIALNNLLQTQTSTGYYTYNKAKAIYYKNELGYIAARELDTGNLTDEYTHGYGAVITDASDTDEAGNIKYITKDFEGMNFNEPRIYYGTVQNTPIEVSNKKQEFDYPKTTTENAVYSYEGDGGINLKFTDRLCVALTEGNLRLIFADNQSKIMINRNVIERAKQIMPYLLYDEKPYLVPADSGEFYFVIDAYTVSNAYPYSQKTKIVYRNNTEEINYIRNSVKVIINAYTGETKFYITDKTDPIAMVYNNMYQTLFEDGSKIPNGISKYFTYSEFLYNIQAEMLNLYHDVAADVLYRGNDMWEIASYSNMITRTASTKMKPYYALVKTNSKSDEKLGLIIAYNLYGKESLNAYLVGTVENR